MQLLGYTLEFVSQILCYKKFLLLAEPTSKLDAITFSDVERELDDEELV